MIFLEVDHSLWTNREFIVWKCNANSRPKFLWKLDSLDTKSKTNFHKQLDTSIDKLKLSENASINEQWFNLKSIIINSGNQSFERAKTPKNRTTKNNFFKSKQIRINNNLTQLIRKLENLNKESHPLSLQQIDNLNKKIIKMNNQMQNNSLVKQKDINIFISKIIINEQCSIMS